MTGPFGRALGRRPYVERPALKLGPLLTGTVPDHPISADYLTDVPFGMYGNDRFGVCGPTWIANSRRLVTAVALGEMIPPTQEDVFDLYRRSGNPQFDPANPWDDNGVYLQVMLDALLKDGIGGVQPLCFAQVDVTNDDELEAAVSIFGGVGWGVDLQVAQQPQTDLGLWDYEAGSGEWGGHAVLDGAYRFDRQKVVTWQELVETTDAFRRHQLQEAWVIVWRENYTHPAFQAGINVDLLSAAYQNLTGQPFPATDPVGPVDPAPVPDPAPEPLPGCLGQVTRLFRRH